MSSTDPLGLGSGSGIGWIAVPIRSLRIILPLPSYYRYKAIVLGNIWAWGRVRVEMEVGHVMRVSG